MVVFHFTFNLCVCVQHEPLEVKGESVPEDEELEAQDLGQANMSTLFVK